MLTRLKKICIVNDSDWNKTIQCSSYNITFWSCLWIHPRQYNTLILHSLR